MPVAPVVVDLAAERCPEADPRARAELARLTPRPAPDVSIEDGPRGLSRSATQAWIDRLEVSERRKSAAGLGFADALDRCRGAASRRARPSA